MRRDYSSFFFSLYNNNKTLFYRLAYVKTCEIMILGDRLMFNAFKFNVFGIRWFEKEEKNNIQ